MSSKAFWKDTQNEILAKSHEVTMEAGGKLGERKIDRLVNISYFIMA